MGQIKLAMCQIFILDGDRAGNFVRIENAIREAKDDGAEIVCLPETSILGWVNPDAHKRAYSIPGKDSDRLRKLAKKFKVYLCAGLEEKDGNRLYDSAILTDDKGKIILKHRKINVMPELMKPPYTPGGEIGAVRTKFGKISVLICADTHEDEILERMAALKPDLLLVPYGYAAPETDWPGHGKELKKVVTKTAKKTKTVVVGTNLVGEITHGLWRGRVYGGQSIAADKNGKVIAVCKDRDRDIRIIAVNTG
jgi:N-carbamoylputrescine amidase